MKLLDLPDEMLINILSFSSPNPKELIGLAHTCRRMEKLFSSDSENNVFEVIKIETSQYLRKGYLFEQFIKKPFGTLYKLFQDYWREEKEIRTEEGKFEECRVELNSREKVLNAFYFAKMDAKFSAFDKKFQDLLGDLARSDLKKLIGFSYTSFGIAAVIGIGQYASNSGSENMGGVLWWIPYIFTLLQGCLGGIWCGYLSYSLIRGLGILRKLNIYRHSEKFHKDANLFVSNLAVPVMIGLIFALGGYVLFSLKSVLYSWFGIETTYSQQGVNTLNYYLSFPIWMYIGVASYRELYMFNRTLPIGVIMESFLSNFIIASFLSLSIYRFGGGYLSTLPLSVALLVDKLEYNLQYLKEKKRAGSFGMTTTALGVSLAIFGFGHHSYLTFAPLAIAATYETVKAFFHKQETLD